MAPKKLMTLYLAPVKTGFALRNWLRLTITALRILPRMKAPLPGLDKTIPLTATELKKSNVSLTLKLRM